MFRTVFSHPSRRLRAGATVATLVAAVALGATPPGLPARAAAEGSATPITAGSLVWGFKQSFRAYTGAEDGTPGALTVRGGASADSHGVVTFPVAEGSFDTATNSTDIRFTGSMQFRAHCEGGLGLPAGQCALDMTFSEIELSISPTTQVLRAHLVGRRNTAGYPFVDNGVIAIANLNVTPAAVVSSGGTTTWSGVVASLAAEAATPTTYNAATPLDPVAFSYTGPGGKPDTGDQFTPAGTRTIARRAGWVGGVPQNQPGAVYVDDRHQVVHVVQARTSFDDSAAAVRPLRLPGLAGVGTGSRASARDYAGGPTAFDPGTGTVFLTGQDNVLAETWDGSRYDEAVVAPSAAVLGLAWDPAHDTLQALVSDDTGVVALESFTLRAGTWTSSTRALPVPANMDPTSYFVPGSATSFAALTDGDLLLTRATVIDTSGSADGNPDPLLLHPNGDEVDVSTVPITTHAHGDSVAGADAAGVTTGPQNRAVFYGAGNTGYGPSVRLATFDGAAVDAAAPQPLPLTGEEPLAAAFDPSDDTVWVKGVTSGTLLGLLDGKTVSRLVDGDTARAYTVQVAADHTIVTGGRTADSHASVTTYQRLGISPTVTTEPTSAATPAGTDVTFTADAIGTPTPTVQWQQRPPGGTTFADLPGATAGRLTVRAAEQDNGTSYRAVFRNPAGTIGSRPATMQVLTAPVIGSQPADLTVAVGAAATFEVMSSGNPEPTVTWQYRRGGTWVDVAAGPTFNVRNGTLTIPHVSRAQHELHVRAEVVNSQGSVHSRTATLTVTAAAGPGTYRDVTLEWSGNEVLQRPSPAGPANYLSAGASDGTEATYRATADDATVRQRIDGRTRTATYATRNAFDRGGRQSVSLRHGTAEVHRDGSATVSWTASWSINFYGGLAPFTITDPVLRLDRNGAGTLRADLSGYGSSQADPTHKRKLAPARDVTVATVRGVHLDAGGPTSVRPAFQGVKITGLPVDAPPQNTARAGWGAWPQSFVDFQVRTGLSSYWYTSGGAADSDKPALPFTVDFRSARPAGPAAGGTRPGSDDGSGSGGDGGDGADDPGADDPGARAAGVDAARVEAVGAGDPASTGTDLRSPLLSAALLLLAGAGLCLVGRGRPPRPAGRHRS